MMDYTEALPHWNKYQDSCKELDKVIDQTDWSLWWEETTKLAQEFEQVTGWTLMEMACNVSGSSEPYFPEPDYTSPEYDTGWEPL